MVSEESRSSLRWRLEADGPETLFPAGDVVERHVGTGEYRGLEFLEVAAKRVINTVPAASRMPFRYTINAYRGCSHACAYCVQGETPVLRANGGTARIADLRAGDRIIGTERVGSYRRYVKTTVLAHWSTVKRAYRVTLEDGTELISSGDHRFLTERGWKHVTGAEQGRNRRPFLTTNNNLIGVGKFATTPRRGSEYTFGYLCGMVRGDGTIGHYTYRTGGREQTAHTFRLALVDDEALDRVGGYLLEMGVATTSRVFQAAVGNRREMRSISTGRRALVERLEQFIEWPRLATTEWCRGFLAGIFDAEGHFGDAVRISNKDPHVISCTARCLDRLGFRYVIEAPRANGVRNVRIVGGLQEVLRFFHTVDPAITRKRDIAGRALKSSARLGVVSIEDLGMELPMYDITTETGDFIANGVVSHNCFARPTHDYLGFNIGEDFDTKIVVKVNAVEKVRAELAVASWGGEHIAMGTNTDPYQKAEGKYHLTRGIVQALGEARNPFSILTKSTLVLRDLDVLTAAAARTSVRLNFSIGTLDRDVWKLTEPGTPPPDKRVDAVRRLNDAGIPCGVLVAPILPGLSDGDDQVRAVVDACADAGAVSISAIPLHLRPGVREHYLEWLAGARPDLMPLYEERFKGRAYQPKAVSEDISQRVRDYAREAERRNGARRPRHVDTSDGDRRRTLAEQGIGDPSAPRAAAPQPEQLSWDL
ncbi:MAG TPA: intein-containing Rv2578c family radical SAM protein [Acidimicrobiales bacterium]|nr:intein-containing Rv2578c family radical SAM protein [Acidimicrobiales bacterium]